MSGSGGNLNAIIANANAAGPTVVTLKPTDKGFETNNCGNWSRRLKRITASKTRFGEGTFIVGLDIALAHTDHAVGAAAIGHDSETSPAN